MHNHNRKVTRPTNSFLNHIWLEQIISDNNNQKTRLGIPKSATVASLYIDGVWLLPPARTEQQLALQIHLTTLEFLDNKDHYEWEIDGRLRPKYGTGEIYTYMKGPKAHVPWAKTVWISYGIPRHSFHSWLVHLDRCPTRDRLIRWGLDVQPHCLLCGTGLESRNHLYFQCSYSSSIWQKIADRCQLQALDSWTGTVLQLQGLTQNKALRRLTLIAAQATIYWIWSERNSRLHRQTFKPVDTIVRSIDRQVRNRLQSLRHANPSAASAMLQLWFLRSWPLFPWLSALLTFSLPLPSIDYLSHHLGLSFITGLSS